MIELTWILDCPHYWLKVIELTLIVDCPHYYMIELTWIVDCPHYYMIELTWIVECPHYYVFTQVKTHLILSWLNVYNYGPCGQMLMCLLKYLWPKFWTSNCESWIVAATLVLLPSTRMRYAAPMMTLQCLTHHPLTRMNHPLTWMVVATTLNRWAHMFYCLVYLLLVS
jgi:hypothetical protein